MMVPFNSVTFVISWSRGCHQKMMSQCKIRISCQSSFRKHPDRMWNVTMQNSKWIFTKNFTFFLLKSRWTYSMIFFQCSSNDCFLKGLSCQVTESRWVVNVHLQYISIEVVTDMRCPLISLLFFVHSFLLHFVFSFLKNLLQLFLKNYNAFEVSALT